MLKQITTQYKVALLLALLIVGYGKSQNMSPKIQSKLDSLYPKFKYIGGGGLRFHIEDPKVGYTQVVAINCNCSEYDNEITITFDTNANILSKKYEFYKIGNLPTPVQSYLKNIPSKAVSYDTNTASKIIDFKGEISYSIIMDMNQTPYIIILNSAGKLISEELLPQLKE